MRYIIIGTGAVGGTIGARLAAAEVPVVLVARGATAAALAEHGLRLRTPDAVLQVHPPVLTQPTELRLDDVLVLATKTQQAEAALETWADAPVAGSDRPACEVLPILTALNGVAGEDLALRRFARVYAVCVWLPALQVKPGEVIAAMAPESGLLHIGRYPRELPGDAGFLAEVAVDFRRSGLAVRLPSDIMAWKYRKLLSNLGNILQALVAGNGDTAPIAKLAVQEAETVYAAAGIVPTAEELELTVRRAGPQVRPVPGEPPARGGSTWQSLERGSGDVETDFLNGEIAWLARLHGVDAPINSALTWIARRAAHVGRRPGEISAAELAGMLGVELSGPVGGSG